MATRPPSLLQRLAPKRPVGAFRGGLIGFLIGVTLAGTYGATHVLTSYRTATAELETTVSDLRKSSAQITGYLKRLDQAEASVGRIQADAATKSSLDAVRADLKRNTENSALDLLDLRNHVFNLEQDVAALRRREATTVRLV